MSDQTKKISATELINLIGSKDVPVIFDVRKKPAYLESGQILPASSWQNYETIDNDLDVAKGRRIVVYCVHGHEVSQSAATRLQEKGHNVQFLEGGIEGYIEAGGPTASKGTA